ncbi:MAG TPA: hypothetical protein EYG34_09615 [Acidimicrobiia bacterium]|nr:hypothetical protein [Acidimicrobiia bacterium]
MRLLDRLPAGTLAIGGGLVVNGLTAYAFITISSRDLGAEAYSPVALLWALSFLLGIGFFLPLEQETARLVAGRVSRGQGIGPVVKSAARLGASLALGLVAVSLLAGRWFTNEFFNGETLLFLGLILVVVGLGAAHLVKGTLAGLGRFNGYARYVMGEGLGRLLLVGAVLGLATGSIGAYGLAIGLAPLVGILLATAGQRGILTPGPEAHMGDLSKALGSLLVASVATALVLNVSPLAVQILATPQQADEPGRFLNALLVARVPLFFFQAVQAALLPRLSTLASQNKFAELWHELKHLLLLVGALGIGAVAVMAVVGPQIVEVAFGAEFAVGHQDMVLLAVSSAGLMVVLSLTQALIACRAQGRMALAWVAGVVAFPLTLLVAGDQLFLRVEIALVATVSVAAVVMFALLLRFLSAQRVFSPAGD